MSEQKIPKRYDRLINEGYDRLLGLGYNKLQCCELLNEEWGTDFPESSMRGRYERTKLAQSSGIEEYEYQNQLFNIAQNKLRLTEARKIMNKERGLVEAQVKQYSEKSICSETILKMWGRPMVELADTQVILHDEATVKPIYAYGDVHWGYMSDIIENKYNPEIANDRLAYFFEWTRMDILAHGYTDVVLADLGDQIEGASLRVSQLLNITECMSEQAKQYANAFTTLLKKFAKSLEDVKITMTMVSEDNHGQIRLFSTKRDEMPENLELLVTNHVQGVVDTAHEFGGLMNLTFVTAGEILLSFGSKKHPFNLVMAHGHQYGRADDILHKVEQRHGVPIHLFIAGHWHQYSIKYKNVKDRGQQALVFLPSVCGDTDFSEHLFLSCYPAFLKITVNLTDRVTNATLIRL